MPKGFYVPDEGLKSILELSFLLPVGKGEKSNPFRAPPRFAHRK